MVITDTSPAARRHYRASWAALDGEERVRLAVEMAGQAKHVALAGIRARNPRLSADEIAVEWIRLLHGPEVAVRIS